MKQKNNDDRMQNFAIGWFIFVALLIVITLFVIGVVALKVLAYFL